MAAQNDEVECEELLSLPNVQLYRLRERKRWLLAEGALRVLLSMSTNDDGGEGSDLLAAGHMLLMIGDNFQYALSKKLPAMRVADRNYVFPSDDQFFGVVLNPETTVEEIEVFETFLQEYAVFRISKYVDQSGSIEEMEESKDGELALVKHSPSRVADGGHKVAKAIGVGGTHLAKGIKTAAVFGGKGILSGSRFVRSKIKRRDEKTEVSDKTKKRIKAAKVASTGIVTVSKALVVGAVAAAGAISTGIANAASETSYGKKLSEQSGPKTEAAKHVVKNSVVAAVEIIVALEEAGLQLLKDTGTATADVLEHRYGEEVGEASKDVMGVAYDLGSAKIAMNKVGVKAMAKRAAAGATIDLASTAEEREEKEKGKPAGGVLAGVNPMVGAGALMVSSQLAQQYDASGGLLPPEKRANAPLANGAPPQ